MQSPGLNPIGPWEEMFSCVPSPATPGVAFTCMFLPGGSADARGCRRAALLRSPLTRRPRAKRGRARRWEPHALRGVGCAWTGAGCHGHDLARSLQVTRHSPARPSWLTCARCFAQVQPGPAGTEQRGRGRLTERRKGTRRSMFVQEGRRRSVTRSQSAVRLTRRAVRTAHDFEGEGTARFIGSKPFSAQTGWRVGTRGAPGAARRLSQVTRLVHLLQ